ncbi:MAG: pyrimidine 5'-nucleotidase [Pseudomonadota bacterium]
MTVNFRDITTWVFDLDNTLYPPSVRLFDQIETRMVRYVMDFLEVSKDQADALRAQYWRSHGTTLAGLMDIHGMPPHDFLTDVHDIDFSVLPRDPTLAAHIQALPGRKIIYTNGTAPYAENVITARGLSGLFDAIYGVEHANFRPKPEKAAFDTVFGIDGFDPKHAIMFEDEPRNLAVPHDMGMTTVHVAPTPIKANYIHYHTTDLADFLTQTGDIGAKTDT